MAIIKGSDLVQKDALKQPLKDLEAYKKGLEELAKKQEISAERQKIALTNVNTARKDGQKQVTLAEKQAEQLVKANESYAKALDKTEKEILQVKDAQKQQNQINKLTLKLNKSAEGSYNKLSAQYSLAKIKLNAMSSEQRKGTKEGQKLEKNSKALFEQMNNLQKSTGKATLQVGDYAGQLSGAGGAAGRFGSAIQGVSAQFKALLANPVVLVMAAIVAVFALLHKAMTRSEEGQDRLNRVMRVAGSIFDNVMDVITSLAILLFDSFPNSLKSVGNLFTIMAKKFQNGVLSMRITWNDFTGDVDESEELNKKLDENIKRIEDLKQANVDMAKETENQMKAVTDSFKNFGKEIEKDIEAANILAANEAKFNKLERKNIVENAKLAGEAAKLRADSELLKFSNTEKAMDLLTDSFVIDEKILKNEIELMTLRLQNRRQESALASDTIEDKREIAQFEADLFNAEKAFDEKRRERTRRLNMLRKESLKQSEEIAKVEAELAKLSAEETIRANKRIIESDEATQQQKIDAVNNTAKILSDVAAAKAEIEQDALDNELAMKLISEADHAKKSELLTARSLNEKLKLEDAAAKQIGKLRNINEKEETASGKAVIEDQKKLSLSEIDLLKVTEEEKTRLKLKAEKERLLALIELNKKFGGTLTTLQIQQMQNVIKKIDEDIAESKEAGGGMSGWLDSNNVVESANTILGSLSEIAAARVESASQRADIAQQELDNAQGFLMEQIALNDEGRDADIDGALDQLARKRKINEQTLKEQKKAEKAQRKIESAQQAASLITATANIFASYSELGIFGQIAAIAAIGSMFAAFASSKAQARKASKFGSGGSFDVNGGTHASGNDTSLGVHGGSEMLVEKGEKVGIVSARGVRKYGGLVNTVLDSLNSGDFGERYGNSFVTNGIGSDGGDMMSELRRENRQNHAEMREVVKNIPQPIFDFSNGEIRKHVRKGNTLFTNIRNRNRYE